MDEEKWKYLDDLKIIKKEYKELLNNFDNNFDKLKQEIKIKENIENYIFFNFKN